MRRLAELVEQGFAGLVFSPGPYATGRTIGVIDDILKGALRSGSP